ncbi:hypothetical protein [Thermosipho melanesiensis]|uniref:Uncharacterized protein n=1 Tax=Thermosipho melanesiensis (strain DSM 12029 / CIP 104789 / BI429) TaxID=391009 RepID=A6LKY5_THEM4|nr:hypothetical protein [Thermosipho melanesiensis]ABR30586.1 hypothetical protein Tmel_0722 [Thermosipho melanesiensis BI429]
MDFVRNVEKLERILKQKGAMVGYEYDLEGLHNEYYWAKWFFYAIVFLFGK